MGFFDRLLGHHDSNRDREYEQQQQRQQQQPLSQQQPQQAQSPTADGPQDDIQPRDRNYTDEQAIDRYKYMLRTAPPETIEQAHAEAFAKLTPEQRQMVLRDLIASAPQHEQPALSTAQDDPRTLAQLATRAEVRQPGTLVRLFGGGGGAYGGYGGMYGGYGGPGYGGMGGGMGGGMLGGMGGGLLGSIAGAFIGTMIADQFFNSSGGFGGFGGFDRDDRYDGDDQGMSYDQSQDSNTDVSSMGYANDPNAGGNGFGADAGEDQGAGFGSDSGGNDAGGDFGGDFGGGDFGGGDFGGGDFGGGGDASF